MPDVKEVFDAIDAKLKIARRGAAEMKNPSTFQAGLWNAALFGRSVTFTLQNLRGKVDGFDAWYEKKQEEMRADTVMSYFVEARNMIEKSVAEPTWASASLNANIADLFKAAGPPPPGAKTLFVGDQFGGSGWQIQLPDGSTEKYYVDFPKGMVKTSVLLGPKAPKGGDAHYLVNEYLTKLEALTAEARAKFNH
ncbi:hypothetical protein [Bradyrhizobium sp. RT7b]|uniref:hypothetical protein n=1 Tax=unclassified Bradyrhizobium TaxID=2631580 RepID=UPI003390BC66